MSFQQGGGEKTICNLPPLPVTQSLIIIMLEKLNDSSKSYFSTHLSLSEN